MSDVKRGMIFERGGKRYRLTGLDDGHHLLLELRGDGRLVRRVTTTGNWAKLDDAGREGIFGEMLYKMYSLGDLTLDKARGTRRDGL